jgi:hypothetical protein
MTTERIMRAMVRMDGRKSRRTEREMARGWVRTARAMWITGGVTMMRSRKRMRMRYSCWRKVLKRQPRRKKVKASIVIASIMSHWALRTLRLQSSVVRGQKRVTRLKRVSPMDIGVISVIFL